MADLLALIAVLLLLTAVGACAAEASRCRPHPLHSGGVDLLDRPASERRRS